MLLIQKKLIFIFFLFHALHSNATIIVEPQILISPMNGMHMGKLNPLVNGGQAPYIFRAITADGGTLLLDEAGPYLFTINSNFKGVANFSYEVIDQNGQRGIGTVDFLVSCPECVHNTIMVPANSTICGDLNEFTINGFDPYSFKLKNQPIGGLCTLQENGKFEFKPDLNYKGLVVLDYQVCDSFQSKANGKVILEVCCPQAQNAFFKTADYMMSGDLRNFVHDGHAPYSFYLEKTDCRSAKINIEPSGIFTIELCKKYRGECQFTYKVVDAIGAIDYGKITIIANDIPVAQDMHFDGLINRPLSGCLNQGVCKGIAPYKYELVNRPSCGELVLNPDGTFIYYPPFNLLCTANFSYKVYDSNEPACASNDATVTIAIKRGVTLPAKNNFVQGYHKLVLGIKSQDSQ